MKTIKFILLFLNVIIMLALDSCKSDPCATVICKNGGNTAASTDNKTCSCNCATGYMGDSCQSKTPAFILTSSTWHISTFTVMGNDYAKPCLQDNDVVFTTSGKNIIFPKGVECNANEIPDTSNYTLSANNKVLTFEFNSAPNPPTTIAFNVLELTTTSVKLYATSPFPAVMEFILK